MRKLIREFREHVIESSKSPLFIHSAWFIKYHLEIVEKIALSICKKYPKADKDFVMLLVWLHDYGKIMDYENQYSATLTQGKVKLLELGFPEKIVELAMKAVEQFDKKENLDKASIEIKIVSSADGASHLVGPFFSIYWKEFSNLTVEELMKENKRKAMVDWNKKIVLPEVKKMFKGKYEMLIQQTSSLNLNNISTESFDER